MAKIAALFSGQGAQYPGMGKDLWERFSQVKEVYTAASDILGFDVAGTSFEGSQEELAGTGVAQPLIFTLSMAAYTAYTQTLPAPAAVAGHSLGEYAALCAAGAYSLEDGFRLIKARATAMEQAAGKAKGAMFAVVGSDEETVTRACQAVEGFVLPVNFNLPNQTVISGGEGPATEAARRLEESGARITRLAVSSAFHTAMMEPAAQRLRGEIAGISFSPTVIPFYSNLTGGLLEVKDYPDYFARHMVSPVQFVKQVAAMVADGVDTCVEFGPKKTAATLAKKNARSLTVLNVEDVAGLQKCAEKLD